VRWDKNFLDINYLLLMRRKKFRLYDGIRFGGTMTLDDAWNLGFDHVSICAGAGKPTLVPLKNNLLRASAWRPIFSWGFKRPALTRQQPGEPATAPPRGRHRRRVDGHRHRDRDASVLRRASREGARPLRSPCHENRRAGDLGELDAEEREIVGIWLKHGRAIRAERSAAAAAGRKPDFNRLVRAWGGVTIVYRKRLQDSPAYRLNHEEVIKSLEEASVLPSG